MKPTNINRSGWRLRVEVRGWWPWQITHSVAVLIVLLATGISALRAASAEWRIETVAGGAVGITGLYPSLALDTSGSPHISYYNYQHRNLDYATSDGTSWHTETVDYDPYPYQNHAVGRYSSLALSTSGSPRIGYHDTGDGVTYAAWNGASWDREVVDGSLLGSASAPMSLALDVTGNPHVSYFYGPTADLRYATKSGSAWQVQTVVSAGYVGDEPSLAIDGSGCPSIAYRDRSGQSLKYAAWDGSAWQFQTVDTGGAVGYGASLAFDSTGNPHISYYDLVDFDLKYAARNGLSWEIQTVDSAEIGDRAYKTSLALDGLGNPHIVYYDSLNRDLEYAVWNGAAWLIETVDSNGDSGMYASLALDASGNPHIAYYSSITTAVTIGSLKYAVAVPEPSSVVLVIAAVVCMSAYCWQRRK